MVYKIKTAIFFIISFLLCILCFSHKNHIETNILNTLLPQNVVSSTYIVPIANKSSSVIKVVFEGNSEDDVEELKNNFIEKINKGSFQYTYSDAPKLLKKYISQPNNFLSNETKNLLQNKKYDEIYQKSIERLYSVSGIQLSALDKDPYLLLDDFIFNIKKFSNKNNEIDNKKYDCLQLKIKNNDALSPDIINKTISELVSIQKELSDKNSKIYLAGTPVHSYYASKNAIISINLICLLSTLLIIFLTYRFFKSFRPLIPIALSLSFGMLMGFCAVKLLFNDFQIITMVFSATLIGIGIDYSYHYFYTNNCPDFRKNLAFSFLTSVIPFILLYLSGIDLLKHVAVFIVFGLLGIYLVILLIYPEFKINSPQSEIKINGKFYKILLIIIISLSFFGILRFHFNDTITSLYNPSAKLRKAEMLYSKISDEKYENTQIIVIKGNNLIEQEEKITNQLIKNNIEYVSISKFLPSKNTQKENFELIKTLYKNNLDNYSDILTKKQIQSLKNSHFTPVEFNIDDYSFLKEFLLDKNTSLIFAFTKEKLNISAQNSDIINFKSDIENYMKKYRHLLFVLLPLVVLILFTILAILYGFKNTFRILLPSLAGILGAILITTLIEGELNLFSIISVFLVIGFTMDYSIFRTNKEKKTEEAILISCITTSFSFLLLSFCGFKLLSSMALILFFGIITSYLTGYFILFKNNHDKI